MAGEGLNGDVLDNPDAPAVGGGSQPVEVGEQESGSSGDESNGEGWE